MASINRGRKESGFTLIEIIVAFAIFSILIVACFRAVTFILDYVERDRAYYQDQSRIQLAWNIVLQDMLHMLPRTERDRLGGISRAYQTDVGEYLLVLTRGGMPSITGTEGGIQRVAYSLDGEGQFLRWTWPSMDLYDDTEPSSQVLVSGVGKIDFLQLNASNEYEANWPPLNQQVANNELPRMIKLVIEMENGGRVERIIPGVEAPTGAARQGPNGAGSGQEDGGGNDGREDRDGREDGE